MSESIVNLMEHIVYEPTQPDNFEKELAESTGFERYSIEKSGRLGCYITPRLFKQMHFRPFPKEVSN